MLLFRSEEHVAARYGERGILTGATLTLEQQWELARIWYADRMSPDWRRRTAEEAEAALTRPSTPRCALRCTGSSWIRADPPCRLRSPRPSTWTRPPSRTRSDGWPMGTSWCWRLALRTSGWRTPCLPSPPHSLWRRGGGPGSATASGTRLGSSRCWAALGG